MQRLTASLHNISKLFRLISILPLLRLPTSALLIRWDWPDFLLKSIHLLVLLKLLKRFAGSGICWSSPSFSSSAMIGCEKIDIWSRRTLTLMPRPIPELRSLNGGCCYSAFCDTFSSADYCRDWKWSRFMLSPSSIAFIVESSSPPSSRALRSKMMSGTGESMSGECADWIESMWSKVYSLSWTSCAL